MSSIASAPSDEQVALLKASSRGDGEKVRELLEDPAWSTHIQISALRISLQKFALFGNASIVEYLVQKGAPIEPKLAKETSALYRAAEMGHVGVVRYLLSQGADVEARDSSGRTALFAAAHKGHREVVQQLLDSHATLEAKGPEDQTVLLYLAAEKASGSSVDVAKLLLERNANIEARDKTQRTPLLWAAATGKEDLVKLLLSGYRRANVNACNDRGRTGLHLAADGGYQSVVRLLLQGGANPNTNSDGGWTPLHNAAQNGHLGVVAELIEGHADVNAQTWTSMTALHWAAQNGHEAVVGHLLGCPDLKLDIKDSDACTPLLRAAQHKRAEIVKLLSPARNGHRLSQTASSACQDFEATIVDFYSSWRFVTKQSVYNLLHSWDPLDARDAVQIMVQNAPARSKPKFKWIHLPSNNIAWVEGLITKYFIEDGAKDVEGFKTLEKCFDQEHRGPTVHSRFMRPYCRKVSMLPSDGNFASPQSPLRSSMDRSEATNAAETPGSNKRGRKKKQKPGTQFKDISSAANSNKTTYENAGKSDQGQAPRPTVDGIAEAHDGMAPRAKPKLVLFMPYLHYETDDGRIKMSEAIHNARSKHTPTSVASKDERLIHAYLDHSPPLHPRRTLDQYFYHAIDTKRRDGDQVVYRYCKRFHLVRRIFMVDQLWLWVLSDELIITSFPQRWGQPKNDPLNVVEHIIEDINTKTRAPIKSVYDLAMLITSRCSGAFDRQGPGKSDYQFLDMFESSLGYVMNRETTLFTRFNKASAAAAKWLQLIRRTRSSSSPDPRDLPAVDGTQLDEQEDRDNDGEPVFLDDLLDIDIETELLAETKDIKDELNIISMVLKSQADILPDFTEAILEELEDGDKEREIRAEVSRRDKEQLKGIETKIKDVERMVGQADGIYTSLTHLLDLKQKHANALEARFSNRQAALTARQGQTIMVFTIVTIVFLPMSFMAAFFAINIQEFPRGPDGQSLHLSYVAKYMLGIGFAISIPLIFIAFTVEDIVRFLRNHYLLLLSKLTRSPQPQVEIQLSEALQRRPRRVSWWSTKEHDLAIEIPTISSPNWPGRSLELEREMAFSPISIAEQMSLDGHAPTPPHRSWTGGTRIGWEGLSGAIRRGGRSRDVEGG